MIMFFKKYSDKILSNNFEIMIFLGKLDILLFDNFFVRIDILERLFMKIINSNKEKEIKMVPEMLNLLGCSKENFKKLLKMTDYKIIEKNGEILFRYMPIKKDKKNFYKKTNKESPFGVLKDLNLN